MRSRAMCVVLTSSRCVSSCKSRFDGRIPLDSFTKLVTLEGDAAIPHVQLKFNVRTAGWLDSDIKRTLLDRYSHRVNANGEFVVNSRRTRSEHLNVADCIDKLRSAVFACEERSATEAVNDDDARGTAINNAKRRLLEYKQAGVTVS